MNYILSTELINYFLTNRLVSLFFKTKIRFTFNILFPHLTNKTNNNCSLIIPDIFFDNLKSRIQALHS